MDNIRFRFCSMYSVFHEEFMPWKRLPYYRVFATGIHRWLADSRKEEPVIRTFFALGWWLDQVVKQAVELPVIWHAIDAQRTFPKCVLSRLSIGLHLLDMLDAVVNWLAPGKFKWNFIYVIFKQILVIDDWGISCEIALILMSLIFTGEVTFGSGNKSH